MNALEVSALTKSYRQGDNSFRVLDDLQLTVAHGESVAILGKSGSGKSTLLTLLAGLEQADSGVLKVRGENLTTLSEEQLSRWRAQNLGIIFQQFHLVSTLTALENVLLPISIQSKDSDESRARELLELVGLSHRLHHFPRQLSGGESQRVAIARALAIRPPLILADEPSGNLDEETGETVMNMLFKLTQDQKIALILVTHDQDLAKRCHRVLRLEQGKLHA